MSDGGTAPRAGAGRPAPGPTPIPVRTAPDSSATDSSTPPPGSYSQVQFLLSTLSHMGDAISVRLDREFQRRLDRVCKRSGKSRSEIVRDALRRQLTLLQFEQARRQLMPFAEARGYLTDEDVYREIS